MKLFWCMFLDEVKFKEMPQAEELLEQLRFINQVGRIGWIESRWDFPTIHANSWIPWPGASNHSSRRQEQQEAPSGNLWGFWDFWDSKNFAEQSSWVLSIYYDHQYRTIILIVIVVIINIYCYYCWLLYSLVSGMSRRDSKTCRSSFFNEHFSKEPRRAWSFQYGSMFHVSSPAVFVNAEVQGAFCSLHR